MSNELESAEKPLTLEDFPLSLRKVAWVYAQSNEYLTFTKACELAGVEPKATQKQYERYRKKGKDLRNLISQNSIKEM